MHIAPQLQKRGPGPRIRASKSVVGDIAADCYERFTRGLDQNTIVQELRIDPRLVDQLWKQWWRAREEFQRSPQAVCVLGHRGPCSGPPSLAAMLCASHAEQATVMSSEEAAVLKDRVIPTALCCQACDSMADQGVCAACLSTVGVAMEDGALVVRAGRRVIKVVDGDELAALLPTPKPIGSSTRPRGARPAAATPPPPVDLLGLEPRIPRSAFDLIAEAKAAVGFDSPAQDGRDSFSSPSSPQDT